MHRRIDHLLRFLGVSWTLLIILLAFPLQAHAQAIPKTLITSYSILGSPTVSAVLIDQILATNNSPAAGSGQAIYSDGVKYGIDPVFALAFFMHESSFGTAGIAQSTHSPGNLRCIPTAACVSGYATFPSWNAGFDAWYQLISNLYVNTWGLTTLNQIIPRYAPPTDNNDDAAYISAVENAVDTWRGNQTAIEGPQPIVNATTTSNVPSSPATSYLADGYSIVGKPTLNAASIDKILTLYHSPAAGKGQALYNAGVKAHIDPVFALALFMHDSIFGTVGMARVTLSLGNLPAPGSTTCQCQNFHGYRQYKSWETGFNDWYQFMQSHYIKQGITTIGQIVPDYSVSKDPAIITAFIKTVEARVDIWRHQYTQKSQSGGTSLSLSSLGQ